MDLGAWFLVYEWVSILTWQRDARCFSTCILHTFWSVNPPHWQWPAPMGSWRVSLLGKSTWICPLRQYVYHRWLLNSGNYWLENYSTLHTSHTIRDLSLQNTLHNRRAPLGRDVLDIHRAQWKCPGLQGAVLASRCDTSVIGRTGGSRVIPSQAVIELYVCGHCSQLSLPCCALNSR